MSITTSAIARSSARAGAAFFLAAIFGLAFSNTLASAEAFIRRVTLDFIGLPPTPAEMDAFVRECAGEAPNRETAGGGERENAASPSPPPAVSLSSPAADKAIERRSIVCCKARTTASAGGGTGSISRATGRGAASTFLRGAICAFRFSKCSTRRTTT